MAKEQIKYEVVGTDYLRLCAWCKHFTQGNTCSNCDNNKQTNMDLVEYAYWSFGCDLFEKGIHESRRKYIESIKSKQ